MNLFNSNEFAEESDTKSPDTQLNKQEIVAVLNEIQEECQGRGFELKEVGSGWRFQVVQETAPWVSRLWEEKPPRYTRAMLETLALIAYRQPITRGDIESIRGVAVSSNIIKTLSEREWVKVVGHRDVPGRPALYATTKEFLDYFNLKSLDELPSLKEIKDLDTLAAQFDFDGDVAKPEQANEGDADNSEGADETQTVGSDQNSGDDESEGESPVDAQEDEADTHAVAEHNN